MTATTPTDTATELAAQGVIEHVDPHTLDIGANVRDIPTLTKEFLASIAENGVLVPITGVRSADNPEVLRVRNGQRRTLAAREVGLSTVPVYVLPAAASDASEEVIARVVHQIVTNDQALALTDAQRAKGIQQMIDAGLSVTKVAKKLSVHKDTVKAASTAASSQAAMEYLNSTQISLEEAAALAEFEDDPHALARLVNAAGTRQFDHTIAQLREARASAEAEAKAYAEYAERGFTVLDERPHRWDTAAVPLEHLVHADGETETEATDADVTDASLWAVLLFETTVLVDKESGELVEEEAVDWNTQDDDAATPEDGLRHANTVEDREMYEPEYFCLDYAATGLSVAHSKARGYFPDTGGTDEGEDASTEREREDQARADAQAKEDADKRERRKVLVLNKLGSAAIEVRREFIKTKVLSRKTAPKGAAAFVAHALARDAYMLTGLHADDTAAQLLGIDGDKRVLNLTKALDAAADARAQVILLGMVLGALEARTGKDAWRNPGIIGGTASWSRNVTGGEYLKFLVDLGYTLAPVEEVITGDRTEDQVYDEYLADSAS